MRQPPRATSRADAHRDGCTRRATVLVADGQGAPGEVAHDRTASSMSAPCRAEWSHRTLRADGVLARLRARTGARIDRLFAGDAPMVRALVIADMGAIDAEQRTRYASAGLVHMLSVSGLHVGIIALALQLLGATLRLPIVPTRVATLVLLVAYVVGIGARPAVRGGDARRAGRQPPTPAPHERGRSGARRRCADRPRTVLDLGWQLSVAGAAAPSRGERSRDAPPGLARARRKLASGAIVSIVATLVTAPLVAWAFGRISLADRRRTSRDPVMGLLRPCSSSRSAPDRAGGALCADAARALIWRSTPSRARSRGTACRARRGARGDCVARRCRGARGLRRLHRCVLCVARRRGAARSRRCATPHPRAACPSCTSSTWGRATRSIRTGWPMDPERRPQLAWRRCGARDRRAVPRASRRRHSFVLSHPHADHVGGGVRVRRAASCALLGGYVGTSCLPRGAPARRRAIAFRGSAFIRAVARRR